MTDTQGITPEHLRNRGNLPNLPNYVQPNEPDKAIHQFCEKHVDPTYSADDRKGYVEKAEVDLKTLLAQQSQAAVVKELENVLTMNGWHEGDWKCAITERIESLKQGRG